MRLAFILCISSISLLVITCQRKTHTVHDIEKSKIKFDIAQLDKNGLTGTDDGKRAITYEFCIPDAPTYRDKVKKIDSTIIFSKSPGRSMCRSNEVLCLGSTNQPNAKKVLTKLSKLEFVEKISETFFE